MKAPLTVLALLLLAATGPARAQSKPSPSPGGKATLTWYGHAAFKLVTASGKVVLFDPWIDNPANKSGKEDLAGLAKADLILVSHGHFDHVGQATEIAKKTGAKLVASFDLGNALVGAGFPKDQFGYPTTGNSGGEIELLDGEVRVGFMPAVHSSTVTVGESDVRAGGNPGGFYLAVKGGPSFYHTGDTDVFGEMASVNSFGKVDYLLACIGDRFTMGPKRAAEAVKLVQPTHVVPMHYGTFPVLTGTPEAFQKELQKAGAKAKVLALKPGQTLTL